MTSRAILTALALSASLVAVSVFAATSPGQPGSSDAVHNKKSAAKNQGPSSANNGRYANKRVNEAPSKLNPLLTDQGEVRIKQMIGSNIYNDHDGKLGSVANVLMGKTGEPTVIVRVNSKLYAVPWSKLRFGDAQQDGHNKVLMPTETKDALTGMPHFHDKTNNGNGGRNG